MVLVMENIPSGNHSLDFEKQQMVTTDKLFLLFSVVLQIFKNLYLQLINLIKEKNDYLLYFFSFFLLALVSWDITKNQEEV
jgi:hypothetical protein